MTRCEGRLSGLGGRARGAGAVGLALGVVVLISGCSGSKESGEVSLFGGPQSAGAALKVTREKPLTLAEGEKLIADIRKHPKRAQRLTPEEKLFLAKTVLGSRERKRLQE